jgi:hypothetical protein
LGALFLRDGFGSEAIGFDDFCLDAFGSGALFGVDGLARLSGGFGLRITSAPSWLKMGVGHHCITPSRRAQRRDRAKQT